MVTAPVETVDEVVARLSAKFEEVLDDAHAENDRLRAALHPVSVEAAEGATFAYHWEDASGHDRFSRHVPTITGNSVVTALFAHLPLSQEERIAELIADLQVAEDALSRCYDVNDWPGDGTSSQDDALRTVRALLKQSDGGEKNG